MAGRHAREWTVILENIDVIRYELSIDLWGNSRTGPGIDTAPRHASAAT